MLYAGSNIFVKAITTAVAIMFLWDQTVWATGLPDEPVNIVLQSDYEDKLQIPVSEDARRLQFQQEDLIKHKQDIENFIYNPLSGHPEMEITDPYQETVVSLQDTINDKNPVPDLSGDKRTPEEGNNVPGESELPATITFKNGRLISVKSADSVLKDITFDTDGNIESASLIKPDGMEYFFRGGSLTGFLDTQGVEYELDNNGMVAKLYCRDTGETFEVTHSMDSDSGSKLTIFTSARNNTQYIYKDELMATVIDSSGFRVDYEYDEKERLKQIDISYAGKRNFTYFYEYFGKETVITDELGNRRTFNKENKIIKMETPYGDTYLYDYDLDEHGAPITAISYAFRKEEDGTLIEYSKGKIIKITRPDGSWIDNIEFDPESQQLIRFSLHTVDGKHVSVIIQGQFVQIEMSNAIRLIFHGNILVAFACPQGIVPLYSRLDGAEIGDIMSGMSLSRRGWVKMSKKIDLRLMSEYIDDSGIRNIPSVDYLSRGYMGMMSIGRIFNRRIRRLSSLIWKVQARAYWRGIRHIEYSSTADALIADLYLDRRNRIGEIFLNVRNSYELARYVQGRYRGRADMSGCEIVFYARVCERVSSNTNEHLEMEAFAQSISSRRFALSCRKSVPFDSSGEWVKMVLPLWQTKRSRRFDPTRITKIGLRVRSSGSTYTGKLEIKYEINNVKGTILPVKPVWGSLRRIARYLRDNRIVIRGSHAIMADIKRLKTEIPRYRLPDDFAAFIVYDRDDRILHVTRADGTTGWFNERGDVDFITKDGNILVDYKYDEEGDLTGTTLVGARQELEFAVRDAVHEVEEKTADILRLLSQEQRLTKEKFMETVAARRRQFMEARSRLENQRYQKVKHVIDLWFTSIVWYETIEVPGITEAIAEVNRQEAEFNRQVVKQLALLDAKARAKREEIEAEKLRILEEYAWQKKKILLNIIHEESVPVIYYYFRKLLGREPDREEILAIFRRLDANNNFAGFFNEDFSNIREVIGALQSDEQNPVYMGLSDKSKEFVSNFDTSEDIREKDSLSLVADLDKILRTYDLYHQLVLYYGNQTALNKHLSARTISYVKDLTFLSKDVDELSDIDRQKIQWLNRYIIQDIYPGITPKYIDEPGFSSAILEKELMLLAERQKSLLFKRTVTNLILAFFDEYLGNPASQAELLAGLGLTFDDVMDVPEDFPETLKRWLDTQDIHFGKSAFGVLKKMFEQKGITVPLEQIAKESLLIDILVGATSPMIDREIEISMFAMSRLAWRYGLQLNNVRVNYSDILGLDVPFITLIEGRHYIIVLSVTESEVTYWDANIGGNGGKSTISRKDFEDNWQGNIITEAVVENGELLSEVEAKKIKGALFGLVVAVIAGIVNAVTAVITAAVNVISAALTGLVTCVGQIATSLIQTLIGIGNVLNLASGSLLGGAGIGGLSTGSRIATNFTLATLTDNIVTMSVNMGTAYSVRIGLESAGVDPIVSGLISNVTAGGLNDFFVDGVGAAFRTALEFGSYTGMNLLGQHLDIDPVITGILTMSGTALTIAGSGSGTSFVEAISAISENVTIELSYYSAQYAGGAMGINSQILYLGGITIINSLRTGFNEGGGPGSVMETDDGPLSGRIELYNEKYVKEEELNMLKLIDSRFTPWGHAIDYGFMLGGKFAAEYGSQFIDAILRIERAYADTMSGTMYNKIVLIMGEQIDTLDLQEKKRMETFSELMLNIREIFDNICEWGDPSLGLPGPSFIGIKQLLEDVLNPQDDNIT